MEALLHFGSIERGWFRDQAAPLCAHTGGAGNGNQGYGLLDERVRFLLGWFKDTLPDA
jgi:hypothetical protein